MHGMFIPCHLNNCTPMQMWTQGLLSLTGTQCLVGQEFGNEHVVDSLPLVLLGIRTALKDDLHCSTAELVYGTTLCLPGEFFDIT